MSDDLTTAKPGDVVTIPDQLLSAKPGDVVSLDAPEIDPIKDLSAAELADLAKKDPDHFNMLSAFSLSPHATDPATVQKVADAYATYSQGKSLPSVSQVGKNVAGIVTGGAKQLWNYATLPGTGVLETVTGAPQTAKRLYQLMTGTQPEVGSAEWNKQLLDDQQLAARIVQEGKPLTESLAGTEVAATGLAEMAKNVFQTPARAAVKAAEKVFDEKISVPDAVTPVSDMTPEQRVAHLFDATAKQDQLQRIAQGKGESGLLAPVHSTADELAKAGTPIDPNEVTELAAGDPFSFLAAGEAFGLAGKAAGAVIPEAVAARAAQLQALAGAGLAKAGGAAVSGAAKAASFVANPIVEKLAVPTARVTSALTGWTHFGAPGAFGGWVAGGKVGGSIARKAENFASAMDSLASVGKQIRTGEIISPYAQLGRSVLTGIPTAATEVGKGAAFDLGLYATAQTPEEAQGVGLGTTFGLLGAGSHLGKTVLARQLIGPRYWGSDQVIPSTGLPIGGTGGSNVLSDFEAMHQRAIQSDVPGVAARVNGVRSLLHTLEPGTDFFLAPDAETLQATLEKAGVPKDQAAAWASQEGFFTGSLSDGKGGTRKIITGTNIDAAPHETSHAFETVLGAEANARLDEWVKSDPKYSQMWDQLGQFYTSRFAGKDGKPLWNPQTHTWQEFLAGVSGWGSRAAEDRIYQDAYNEISAATGAKPTDAQVRELAAGRSHTLTPEEINAVADQYLSREIRAENWDALVKKTGPSLTVSPNLVDKLSHVVARTVSALGGDPLAGTASQIGRMPLSLDLIERLQQAGKDSSRPIAEPPSRAGERRGPPVTDQQQRAAADSAKAEAAKASTTPPEAGAMSPQQVLGTMAEAMGGQNAVLITGRSAAPGDPSSALASNRNIRRAIIETWRRIPDAAKALVQKVFYPTRVIKTKGGAYQVEGWSPEVLAANAHKAAEFFATLSERGKPLTLPEGVVIDPATKSFTPESWKHIFDTLDSFAANQRAGRTGAGEPLVVPREVRDAGAFAPPTRGGVRPLPQDMADFLNYLYNFKIPDTPIIRQGRMPMNVQAQRIAAATEPGRPIVEPATPRGAFGEYGATEKTRAAQKAAAEKLGIAGMQVKEVNPFRQSVEQAAKDAGIAAPSLFEVIQHLNAEGIKSVEHAPEVKPQIPANSLTLTAGFQPKPAYGVWPTRHTR